jgi:hypothetical protein
MKTRHPQGTTVQNRITATRHSVVNGGYTIHHSEGNRVTLSCHRCYPNIKNKFGGIGVSVPTSHNGMEADSPEHARDLLYTLGYYTDYRR